MKNNISNGRKRWIETGGSVLTWRVVVACGLTAASTSYAATCSWQVQDFGIAQWPDRPFELVASGIADNGEIIINTNLGQGAIGPDATWLTSSGGLIDLQALIPPEYPRSNALFISRAGTAVVGDVHGDKASEYDPAAGYWVYKDGVLKLLTLASSMRVGGSWPKSLELKGVTDNGDVYGTAMYRNAYRSFGSTDGIVHTLGKGSDVAQTMTLANRIGTTLSGRFDPQGQAAGNVIWQADSKGRWTKPPVVVEDEADYFANSLSDNGLLLMARYGGPQYDPDTALKVFDPRAGRTDTAPIPVDLRWAITRIAPAGNHFGATLTYRDSPLREVAARFDRAHDGSLTRVDFRVPGALSNNVGSVNSRGDLIGYYRTSDVLTDHGSPYIVRDGVITTFATLSPTVKASGGLLGDGGQLALEAQDSDASPARPVVLTCVPAKTR